MAGKEAVGALWLNESRDGKKYMSGSVDLPCGQKLKVVVFKNTYKQPGEKTPDYKIYPAEDRGAGSPPPPAGGPADDDSDQVPF